MEAAAAEFGVCGFSQGSLNVIARRAGVAKGSLFQYVADKRDLYARTGRSSSFSPTCSTPGFAYFAEYPRERALHAAATLEVDTDARISVRSVIRRHYLEVLRPLVRDAQVRGDLRPDSDNDALLSLLLMIFPHLAWAPYLRGLDPILGLDEPTPEQPVLAVRRFVAVLAAAFSAVPNSSISSAPN